MSNSVKRKDTFVVMKFLDNKRSELHEKYTIAEIEKLVRDEFPTVGFSQGVIRNLLNDIGIKAKLCKINPQASNDRDVILALALINLYNELDLIVPESLKGVRNRANSEHCLTLATEEFTKR